MVRGPAAWRLWVHRARVWGWLWPRAGVPGLPLVLGAWALGFRGADLAILFLYFASPTAAASFVMARAANGNHELAAAIIVITTLMAAITTNIGIFVLQWGGWI